MRFSVRCAAAIGWSEPKGQQILRKKGVNTEMSEYIGKKAYRGIPLPRDSVVPLKPQCVTNHPVAYIFYFILSIEPRQSRNKDIIPGDLK